MAGRRVRVPSARDEVYDGLRAEMRRLGAGHGTWKSQSAADTIGTVADATETCLRARLREVDVVDVLTVAAADLAHAIDGHFEVNARNGTRRDAAQAQMHQQNAAAAHAVLELAARMPVDAPRRKATRRDLEAIATLAHQLWRWRRLASLVNCRLRAVGSIRLTPRNLFEVEATDVPPFHMSAYERAMVARVVDNNAFRGADDARLIQGLDAVILDGSPIPEELRDLDQAMQADRSYGLADHLSALELLVHASRSQDSSAAGTRYPRDGLAELVKDNLPAFFPGSDPARILEAIRRLTWDQELLLQSPLQLLEDRTSSGRLYSRPVIELSDGSFFVPRHAPGMARVAFLQRVLEGTWPEQLGAADTRMASALRRRRSLVRPVHGFESHVAETLAAIGLPHAVNVSQSGGARVSIVAGVPLRSEIDAIVVSWNAAVVWVIEAKDLEMPVAPRRIRTELDKYFGARGHVAKLASKVRDIEADPAEVARRLGAHPTSDRPAVRGVFVTREPSPAWFHDEQVHECVAVDQLPTLLGRSASESSAR